MIERFQIEDLVVQDSNGVLFRALDLESGKVVALRRLLPCGPDGRGLNAEEQVDYQITVEKLSAIAHPALRSVVCGGCDPIDGMPFIATEWVEGTRLEAFLERGPLGNVEAADLLTKLLEVCELLSQVLGEEGIWVETDPMAIVVGAEGTGRGVTFWISPLKWLGKDARMRGLESVVMLTEEIKGWRGRSFGSSATGPLGEWLKWLRGHARATTLHEARQRLAAAIGNEPPVPTKSLVRHATAAGKKTKTGMGLALAGCLVLTALGGWALMRKSAADKRDRGLPAPEILETGMVPPSGREGLPEPADDSGRMTISAPGEVPHSNRGFSGLAGATPRENNQESAAKSAMQSGDIAGLGEVYRPQDRELIAAQKGRAIVVEGVLEKISRSSKTLYLLFSTDAGRSDTRGAINIGSASADLTEEALAPLVGKKIRLHGQVKIEALHARPTIVIQERKAIEAVE